MIMVFIASLRSGGITSAVRNSSNSVPERLLKILGRWKSDSAEDIYVEESLENLKKRTTTIISFLQSTLY